MNLAVSTNWPQKMPVHLAGKATLFGLKIITGLKPHTIREDKSNRWKEGRVIQFFEWEGKPYRSKQVKITKAVCKSVQNIEIVWKDPDGLRYPTPSIFVDGLWIVGEEKKRLALNDGFGSLMDFYAWFDKDFTGKIIHWTDLRY